MVLEILSSRLKSILKYLGTVVFWELCFDLFRKCIKKTVETIETKVNTRRNKWEVDNLLDCHALPVMNSNRVLCKQTDYFLTEKLRSSSISSNRKEVY